jgi:hypothetical protein
MRLLNVDTYQLDEFFGEDIPYYAILSHTWLESTVPTINDVICTNTFGRDKEEVTFSDLQDERSKLKQGWQKIRNTCREAKGRGYQYAWVGMCFLQPYSKC